MNITPIAKDETVAEKPVWVKATISSAQRTLDNILYSMTRESTQLFAQRIQKLIDEACEDNAPVSDIASLSVYVDLLRTYEKEGAFCHLKELSDRLNAHDYSKSLSKSLQDEEESEELSVA